MPQFLCPAAVLSLLDLCAKKKLLLLLFSPHSQKWLSSQNAKVPLHLETFIFGEKIKVNEKPSNPKAQISLDEWL